MALSDELEALARKHGATSYRNRADTQNPAYGFTPAGLLNLLAEVTGELRKQDEALICQMMGALVYHREQTRPIERTDDAIAAAFLRLDGGADHPPGAAKLIAVAVEADEVLVAIKRPEGYEDVHPELLAEDVLPCATFEYRVVWPAEVAP